MLKRYLSLFACLAMGIGFVGPSFSADVFYLGGAGGSSSSEQNESYSLKERFHDLLDVTSGRDMSERSGRISGSLLIQGESNRVSGNRSKSFLRERENYLTETNLNFQEKLRGDYNLEAQIMLRKTDNPRIEVRRDVRMKQFNIKVSNPDNLYQFGDMYADFSQYTLSSSLEGFGADVKVNDAVFMKYVLARQYGADEAASQFQRNVFGVKSDFSLFQDSEIFSNFRLGVQAVTNQDDSSSPDEKTASFDDMRNTVMSVDGEISFIKYLSLTYEVARSFYLEDEEDATTKDQSSGNAFQIAPQLRFGDTTLRYLYNYTQPQFYTDSGSAAN